MGLFVSLSCAQLLISPKYVTGDQRQQGNEEPFYSLSALGQTDLSFIDTLRSRINHVKRHRPEFYS